MTEMGNWPLNQFNHNLPAIKKINKRKKNVSLEGLKKLGGRGERAFQSERTLKHLQPELGSVGWRQVGIKTVRIFHAMHWGLDFMLQMADSCNK